MTDNADDELIEQVAAALRARGAARPGFDARVMARIGAPPPSPLRTALAWLTEPQSLAVSPLGMLAAAAALMALMVGTAVITPQVRSPASVTTSPAGDRGSPMELVRFVFAAPSASRVALIGSFNNWNPEMTPLRRAEQTGIWVADVPLAPGRHEYGFLIDGREWRPDPGAPRGPDNEYGPPNSVVLVSVRQS